MQNLQLFLFALLIMGFSTPSLQAKISPIETVEVTFGKATKYYEDQLSLQKKDSIKDTKMRPFQKLAKTKTNFAYFKALQYAEKKNQNDTVTLRKSDMSIWARHHTPAIFFQVKEVEGQKVNAESQLHLKKAIGLFRESNQLRAGDFKTLLGLAWCLELSGENKKAIETYREALMVAGKSPEKKVLHQNDTPETVEAGTLLKNLLDPKEDKSEITAIEKKIAKSLSQPRKI